MNSKNIKKGMIFLIGAIVLFFLFTDSTIFNDKVLEFASTPFIITLILTVATALIVIELFLPTFGIAGILGILLYGVYFAVNIYSGHSSWLSLFLFLTGIVLLGIEAIIPGFGITGISGIILIILGLVFGMGDVTQAIISLSIATIVGFSSMFFLIRRGYNSKLFDKIILHTNQSSSEGYVSGSLHEEIVGMKGFADTNLRPSGFIIIGNSRYDAVSIGEWINKGDEIEVDSIEGLVIKVRRI